MFKWKNSREIKKTFYLYSKLSSWYPDSKTTEKISFQVEGVGGEIVIEWVLIDKDKPPIAKVMIYADAFRMLSLSVVIGIFKSLNQWNQYDIEGYSVNYMQPRDFIEILHAHGFREVIYTC